MEREGRALPESIVKMLAAGAKSFYQAADANGSPKTQYFDLSTSAYKDLETRPGVTVLSDVKRARGVVKHAGSPIGWRFAFGRLLFSSFCTITA